MSFERIEQRYRVNMIKALKNVLRFFLIIPAGLFLGDTWFHSFGLMIVLYIMMPVDWPESLT